MSGDQIVSFESDDHEMAAAVDAAKASLRQFLETFLEPERGQESFLLKVAFIEGEQVEHIWVADLELDGMNFRGVIANEPSLPCFRFKQPVEFEPRQITDWMFIQDGRLMGGYTTRLIRQRMTPEERESFDTSVPFVL